MKFLCGLYVLAISCAASAQPTFTDTPSAAPPVKIDAPAAPPRSAICATPLLTAMVTDDPYNTPADAAERWRYLKIPAWHATARKLAEQSRCFNLIDPDPLLLALPGAPLPDVILRLRPVKLVLYEKTIADKVDAGVRGYIESYTTWLGAKSTTDGPPMLSAIELTLSVLCPRERRVERELAVTDNAPPQPLINQNREYTGAQQNAARAERAIAKALDDISYRLARGEKPCAQTQIDRAAMSPAIAPPGSSLAPGAAAAPAVAMDPAK